ncbi:glycosyltransferase family 49 protein [Polyporus arcularius HHB13444]|uniref:Glycosyltransferase family 49 protein n=1 Tax=Polyporus arcularius HHB13444 TaxID=1314778 RepID=A0A5C3PUA6_9APHY|nr:glycosyltransferase family 49 protein [Polyporus arcularius HHB13444]
MSGGVVLRLLQFSLGLYAAVAVIHTTWLYLLLPLSRLSWPSTASAPATAHRVDRLSQSTGLNVPELNVDLDLAVLLDDDHWADVSTSRYASSELVQLPRSKVSARKIGRVSGYGVNEETLLSKAFSEAMHPTRIIPFYFKAAHSVDPDDVTITTLVTSNRFRVFKQLVERYRGPISVTIHIPLPLHSSFSTLKPDHPSRAALNSLHALYASSPLFSRFVDVHLALSPFTSPLSSEATSSTEGEGGRQFNVWRNAARLFARTDFVMMLDVDFAVCTDWRGFIRDTLRAASSSPIRHTTRTPRRAQPYVPDGANGTEIVQRLREGSAALVVPAFEHVKQEDGVDQRSFPGDKQTLIKLVQANPPVIASFHASWGPGHSSTDYERYYSIPAGSGAIYKVEQYQSAYEPYVITNKRVSWCDERFAGYGGNKAACLFEMYLSGVSFYVLSDHFLIHQSHKYEEEARREERKSNRKVYADFKEESCLRYLYRYYREGTLHTERAANAREECKKIKNISKTVSQLING